MVAKKTKKRKKFYIGKLKGKGHWDREIFGSTRNPTESSHGHKYGYIIGPFATIKRAKKEIGQ